MFLQKEEKILYLKQKTSLHWDSVQELELFHLFALPGIPTLFVKVCSQTGSKAHEKADLVSLTYCSLSIDLCSVIAYHVVS